METIKLSVLLNATPEKIYKAWMDGKLHTAMTGAQATIVNKVGGAFTAWDGYISGYTTAMEPYKYIVQNWRTTEFPENAPDSQLEIIFEDKNGKTQLVLIQHNIPSGNGIKYKEGWEKFYFEPMKNYFGELVKA